MPAEEMRLGSPAVSPARCDQDPRQGHLPRFPNESSLLRALYESECWGRVKCNSVPHKLRLLSRDAAFFQEFASRIRAVYLEAILPVVPLGQTEIVHDRCYGSDLSVRCYRCALCKDDSEQPRAHHMIEKKGL